MSATPYPPTGNPAVLSAMGGLTAEFGMGSGDPPLRGRARRGRSPARINMWYRCPGKVLAHPGGRMRAWAGTRIRDRDGYPYRAR